MSAARRRPTLRTRRRTIRRSSGSTTNLRSRPAPRRWRSARWRCWGNHSKAVVGSHFRSFATNGATHHMRPDSRSITLSRRALLRVAGALPLLAVPGAPRAAGQAVAETGSDSLANIATSAKPISEAERRARIARAQVLMAQHGIGAVVI